MKDAIQMDLFTGRDVPAAFRREEDRWRQVRWVCLRCARVYFQGLEPKVCACVSNKVPKPTFGGSGRG